MVAPSYATYCATVRKRNKFVQTLKRMGRRAAYQHTANRPFEIGHVDHTQLDVEVICSKTGRALGRPWLT